MSHLVIVDGHAIAHRAYHSIPPLTVNGQPVNAIYGFYSMILSAVGILKPNYFIVCLDSPGPTTRQQDFIGYRAKRQIPDVNLIAQLPELPKTLETAKITHYAVSSYEADDLIATITRLALKKVGKTSHRRLISKITIITGDKDLMQLVDDKVSLFVPIRGLSETKIFSSVEVKEKLGVNPNQVVDLKALMGDMSDNYPGVPGIGPKSAVDLLTKYQNLNNIYQHLDEIKESVRQKLIKDKESAYLSQSLATLISTVPVKLSLKKTRWNNSHAQNLDTLFNQYNFKSLSARLHRRYPQEKVKIEKSVDPNQTSLF
jgi:DNA polymerase-1